MNAEHVHSTSYLVVSGVVLSCSNSGDTISSATDAKLPERRREMGGKSDLTQRKMGTAAFAKFGQINGHCGYPDPPNQLSPASTHDRYREG